MFSEDEEDLSKAMNEFHLKVRWPSVASGGRGMVESWGGHLRTLAHRQDDVSALALTLLVYGALALRCAMDVPNRAHRRSQDETAEEKAGRPDGSPKTLRHETESNIDKQREKELVRAQLQALKYLQARQQKQLKQLEKVRWGWGAGGSARIGQVRGC